MKTKKSASKQPAFKVDLRFCNTPEEIYASFGFAKQRAGLPMTNREFSAIIWILLDTRQAIQDFVSTISDCMLCTVEEKKPNVFKRFWNWITRKNKKQQSVGFDD